MSSSQSDVRNYNLCNIYREDIALLDPGKWLNDTIIHYVFERFTHDDFKELKHLLRYVPPQTAFIIQHDRDEEDVESTVRLALQPAVLVSGNELKQNGEASSSHEGKSTIDDALQPDALRAPRFIFLPINNSAQFNRVSGTHWSLLVVDREQSLYLHFDSSSTRPNTRIAEQFAQKLHRTLLSLGLAGKAVHSFRTVSEGPVQQNTFDCGVYVLITTSAIGTWITRRNQNLGQPLPSPTVHEESLDIASQECMQFIATTATAESCTALRREIKHQLEQLFRT